MKSDTLKPEASCITIQVEENILTDLNLTLLVSIQWYQELCVIKSIKMYFVLKKVVFCTASQKF